MAPGDFKTRLVSIRENMLSYAYVLTSNKDKASDLVQDTMLKALANSNKYADNVNFKGWVFTIMRNVFINSSRRDRFSEASSVDELSGSGECAVSPEGTLAAGEIASAIDSFTDEYRLPFAMHVAGYKYCEIAVKMCVPIGTVKSRIFTARRTLQQQFADYL